MRSLALSGCRAFALLLFVGLIGLGSLAWARYVEPRLLTLTTVDIPVPDLPAGLAGTRLVLLADLHGASFGSQQSRLLSLVARQDPQAIFFAGDLVGSPNDRHAAELDFLAGISQIAPSYMVWGNHDLPGDRAELETEIERRGINVRDIDDAWATVQLEGGTIALAGLARSWRPSQLADLNRLAQDARAAAPSGSPLIVVTHSPEPEVQAKAAAARADLLLCGHTHGGQIRLPLLGALWSPVGGLLPGYTQGLKQLDHGKLFTSRGLGTSILPLRFFCPPEVVVLTLQPAPQQTAADH